MSSVVFIIIKAIVSADLVVFITWLSKTNPTLAGFFVVLPTISVLSMVFSFVEQGAAFDMNRFARGALVGIPVLLCFFLPFLFIRNFHPALALGFCIIVMVFFAYKFLGYL